MTKKTMRIYYQNERCTLNKKHFLQCVINVLQVGVYATNHLLLYDTTYVRACVRGVSLRS